MTRPTITLLVLLSLPASLAAQGKQRLTLREAEEIAIKNNPSIAVANFSALAAAEIPSQYAAATQPVVTANLTGVGAPENSRLGAGGINNPIIYSRLASVVRQE